MLSALLHACAKGEHTAALMARLGDPVRQRGAEGACAQVAALASLLRELKLDIFALKRQEGGLEALLQARGSSPPRSQPLAPAFPGVAMCQMHVRARMRPAVWTGANSL